MVHYYMVVYYLALTLCSLLVIAHIKSAMMIISIYDYDWTRFKVYDYFFEIDSKLKTDRFRIYL